MRYLVSLITSSLIIMGTGFIFPNGVKSQNASNCFIVEPSGQIRELSGLCQVNSSRSPTQAQFLTSSTHSSPEAIVTRGLNYLVSGDFQTASQWWYTHSDLPSYPGREDVNHLSLTFSQEIPSVATKMQSYRILDTLTPSQDTRILLVSSQHQFQAQTVTGTVSQRRTIFWAFSFRKSDDHWTLVQIQTQPDLKQLTNKIAESLQRTDSVPDSRVYFQIDNF